MGSMTLVTLLKRAAIHWIEDGAFQHSAALAYYAIFSVAPILIIITLLVGLVYGGDPLQEIQRRLGEYVSPQAAEVIAQAIVNASPSLEEGLGYAALAGCVMLAGVSAFTHQLRTAINAMWNIPAPADFGFLR
jgi:membrane protein